MKYNEKPVITTRELAKLYELPQGKLYQHFIRYKSCFQEEVHYLVLSGREMEQLKSIYPELKRTNMMYVWTVLGAYEHLQFLKGEQAWNGYCQWFQYFFSENDEVQISIQHLQQFIQQKIFKEKGGLFL